MFIIQDKVALITGGAKGIGLAFAKELLKNGLKAAVLADLDETAGQTASKEIEKEFGPGKVIFVLTDVTKLESFEDAFKTTVNSFGHIDILVNNAGLYNEIRWEDQININVKATLIGTMLGIDVYLAKYKKGTEGLILNVASICGVDGYNLVPIYCATKHAVVGMTKSYGQQAFIDEVGVKVMAICPGFTMTPSLQNFFDKKDKVIKYHYRGFPDEELGKIQSTEFLMKESIKIIKYADNGSVWIIEDGPAYQYQFPDRQTMVNNTIKEVEK